MARFVIRRLLVALAVAAGISVASYVAIYSHPDDAVRELAAARNLKSDQDRQALREQFGLDRPLPVQLGSWLRGLTRGELGMSWSRPGKSVAGVLGDHLLLTLLLTASGLVLQIVLGILLAALGVRRPGGRLDALLSSGSLALYAMPGFCLALLLIWVLSTQLGWFPSSGASARPWETTLRLGDRLHHLVLPVLTLGLGGTAVVARLLRTRWGDEMRSAYAMAARARGQSRNGVLWRHTLRAATGPLCTAVGLSLPALLGGAVIVEQVFNWPGLGSVMMSAVAARDLPLLAGVNLVVAVLVSLGGLASDFAWMLADPRVRQP